MATVDTAAAYAAYDQRRQFRIRLAQELSAARLDLVSADLARMANIPVWHLTVMDKVVGLVVFEAPVAADPYSAYVADDLARRVTAWFVERSAHDISNIRGKDDLHEMTAQNCYRVELKTTNALRDTANLADPGDEDADAIYIAVEDDALYVIGPNAAAIAAAFPHALSITRVGVGYLVPAPRRQPRAEPS